MITPATRANDDALDATAVRDMVRLDLVLWHRFGTPKRVRVTLCFVDVPGADPQWARAW